MPFKFDADGHIVLQEVNGQKLPVFTDAQGKEAPFDADSTVATIGRLNGEAKGHREDHIWWQYGLAGGDRARRCLGR